MRIGNFIQKLQKIIILSYIHFKQLPYIIFFKLINVAFFIFYKIYEFEN